MEEEEEATTAATSTKDQVVDMPSSPPQQQPLTSTATPSHHVHWAVGARLESKARDSNGGEQWFPAKVLDIEPEGRGVLVHYMQWNARHDEWIPSNSPRLRPASGKNSRHNSGETMAANASDSCTNSSTPVVSIPAIKDFKPGEKVMATWKLNRKYLATVIRFEASDNTYLVEFYDGVQCRVKPNSMRWPRKGETDVEQQEALRVNGAADNGSAENSDCEDLNLTPGNGKEVNASGGSSSGRRERKRKFDVKQLLNIRSVKSLRSNSKDDNNGNSDEAIAVNSVTAEKKSSEKRKRRPERTSNSQKKSTGDGVSTSASQSNQTPPSTKQSPTPTSSVPSVNGSSKPVSTPVRGKLEDGPALAAVSGKRERRKKKFWDDEEDNISTPVVSNNSGVSSSNVKTKELSSSNMSSSALKRKSSSGVTNPLPKKSSKKADKVPGEGISNNNPAKEADTPQQQPNQQPSQNVKPNGSVLETEAHGVGVGGGGGHKPSGKENGKVLPYLQLDLTAEPELLAEQMIEGVNIPGMGQPIPVDSSSLPEGWEKRVIQRRIGITKGKWDVFITYPKTGKSFRSKTELQKHLDERGLPYTSEAFDFSLDDNLKKLRQIWKTYKVKPFLNNPKGTGSSNFKHVPAKITQTPNTKVSKRNQPEVGNSGETLVPNHASTANHQLPTGTPTSTGSTPTNSKTMSSTCPTSAGSGSAQPASNSLGPFSSDNDLIDMACLSEIAVDSETGQGLRCSICKKLFRNDRLLRQHVKHYHPKVYESLLYKHPQIAQDISEPTSPEARRISESGDADSVSEPRRRIPSSEGGSARRSSMPFEDGDHLETAKLKRVSGIGGHKASKKTFIMDEDSPLLPLAGGDYGDQDEDAHLYKRTRNDSVLSSINSDTDDLSVGGDPYLHPSSTLSHGTTQQPQRNTCPATPPTFRLSKRRQAQMRKRVPQAIVRVNKIEDTPLGRDYRDELLSLTTSPTSSTVNPVNSRSVMGGSSNPGSTNGLFGLMINSTSPTSGASSLMLDNSSSNNGVGLASSSSYPPSEMDASIAGSEHLTNEELVNCTCRRVEEDGLMIQCDICLCWQHGYCVGIEDEDPVPEKHVCETCKQPPGGRTEARFSFDQDWLKEGKLPSCDSVLDGFVKAKSNSALTERETAFRKLSELMADLANLDKVLHGLRVKLHVASQSNNSKVFMWSSVWSLPTHQPISDELDEDDEAFEVAEAAKVEQPQNIHGTAIDPHAVAEKLTLLANQTQQDSANETSPPSPPSRSSIPDDHQTGLPETQQLHQPKVNGLSESNPPNEVSEEIKKETPSANTFQSETKNDEHASQKEPSSHPDDNTDQAPPVLVDKSNEIKAEDNATPSISSSNDSSIATPISAQELEKPLKKIQENGIKDDVIKEYVKDHPKESPEAIAPLTNGSDPQKTCENNEVERSEDKKAVGHNGTGNDVEDFDTSFIPSVSEVEALLPSVIQEIEAVKNSLQQPPNVNGGPSAASSHNSSLLKKAASNSPAVIIPKRLDRDECRLNLLQHIESVQDEIDNRYKAIESSIAKIEAMPGAINAGFTSRQLLGPADGKLKAKLNQLIQDLSTARQLTWTL